jgi:hypothetical protein
VTILVCGSRTFDDYPMVWQVLDGIRDSLDLEEEVAIVHGGARGPDQFAAAWGRSHGYRVEGYYPCWELGRDAGFRRNEFMCELRPDLVLAFWDGISYGTAHTIRYARSIGVPTEVWRL